MRLFESESVQSLVPDAERQRELHQFFTPDWAAEELVQRFFSTLGKDDIVYEPTAGTGAFLLAIPRAVPAFGTEIDAELARIARTRTGRPVIVGDALTTTLPERPTAVVGNIPFRNDFLETLLNKLYAILARDSRVGLIVPTLAFGSSARVARFNARWSIEHYNLPRYLFPRLSEALSFAIFSKDAQRRLIGFALYDELDAVNAMQKGFRAMLQSGSRPPWRVVFRRALELLGGEGSIADVTRIVTKHHLSRTNNFVRAKLRQVAPLEAQRVRNGVFRLTAAGQTA